MAESDVRNIALDQIAVGQVALRPAQLEKDSFKELLASIKSRGILTSLLVRPSDEDPDKPFMLIDGLQRYTCATLLKLQTVPVHVVQADDERQVLMLQMHTNLQGVKTQPAAAGRAIRRMMVLDTTLTITEIAQTLSKSPTWVKQRINLQSLLPEIAELVDAEKITAQKAYHLSKLPPDEQPAWVKRALDEDPARFIEDVAARVKTIKDAARAGTAKPKEEYSPAARMRPVSVIKAEVETHAARATLVTDGMSAVEAFDLAVQWALHLDPPTVNAEKAKWEADREAAAARKVEEAAARKARKEAAAAEKQAEIEQKREDAMAALIGEDADEGEE